MYLSHCIVTVIAEENVIPHKERAPILLLYLGGGIATHVVRKEKILPFHQMSKGS
jgi:hypothetical protein